jgi:glutamine synthetase
MATAADVLKLIKEKEVKFVDLRFTDTKGKEQHVTVPTRMVDDSFFEDGKGFDGSSIAGWKGIQESDMILMPDPRPRSWIRSMRSRPCCCAAT